ncbi:MAG: TetR/AcrR family transcriptional regulator, partial [Idiomarina sp.]|nr:TetR/AcrR family transcriptional regulator [Idiomarina sp.]
MTEVARRAGIATGTLYRYFTSKEQLACTAFERATRIEVAQVEQALCSDPHPLTALENALRVFARRALRAPTLAWALIAEPVDAAVDQKRLEYRLQYANLFAHTIERAMSDQLISRQRAMLTSTAIVGAIAEALIGPLAHKAEAPLVPATQQQLIDDIIYFCLHGLSVRSSHA